MLAYSPPLPLFIKHDYEDSDIAVEDEEGLILALEQRNRIRRINLWIMMNTPNLQKFIMAIDEESSRISCSLWGKQVTLVSAGHVSISLRMKFM
jgi:hypothetical protein